MWMSDFLMGRKNERRIKALPEYVALPEDRRDLLCQEALSMAHRDPMISITALFITGVFVVAAHFLLTSVFSGPYLSGGTRIAFWIICAMLPVRQCLIERNRWNYFGELIAREYADPTRKYDQP
jgi:hypothetical protein